MLCSREFADEQPLGFAVYAGATVLSRITVGKGSVIGGNVWLTESVPPGSRITQVRLRSEESAKTTVPAAVRQVNERSDMIAPVMVMRESIAALADRCKPLDQRRLHLNKV